MDLVSTVFAAGVVLYEIVRRPAVREITLFVCESVYIVVEVTVMQAQVRVWLRGDKVELG